MARKGTRTTRKGPIVRLAAACVMSATAVLFAAAPVGAHGEVGELEVGDPQLVDTLTVEFPIRVTYADDGHAAEEVGAITVRGTGPDGQELGPVEPFTAGDAPGVYVATLELPAEGVWDLQIEVTDPAASAAVTADTTAPADSDPGDAPDADRPPTTAPAPDPGEPDADDPADLDADGGTEEATDDEAADDDGDDGGGVPVLVPILVGLVVGAGLGLFLWSRRRST